TATIIASSSGATRTQIRWSCDVELTRLRQRMAADPTLTGRGHEWLRTGRPRDAARNIPILSRARLHGCHLLRRRQARRLQLRPPRAAPVGWKLRAVDDACPG